MSTRLSRAAALEPLGAHRSPLMAVEADGRSDQLGTTVLLGVGVGSATAWFGRRASSGSPSRWIRTAR